jgi:hypothetical protein
MQTIEIDNTKYEFHDDVWAWRQLFLKSEWMSTKYLCGFHEGNVKKGIISFPMYAYLHGRLINAIQYKPWKNLFVTMPRRYGKSTAVTVGDSIYSIIKNRNIRIGIAPGNMKLGKQFLDQIKHIIKSPLFRACFPEIVPTGSPNSSDSNWARESCTVNRSSEAKGLIKEPTVDLITENSVSEGYHYDKIIGNDLVHRDNYKTENARESTKEFVRNFENLKADKDTPIIIEGTFWHPDDLYTSVILPNPEYATYYLPLYDREGNITFPEQFTPETIRALRRKLGEKLFTTQYLLQPIAEAEAPLSQYKYTRYDEIRRDNKIIRVTEDGKTFETQIIGAMAGNDTAGSGRNLAGLSGVELSDDDVYFVRYGKLKPHWTPLERYQELKLLDNLINPYKIGIELASQLMWDSVLPQEALTGKSPIKHKLDKMEHRNEPKSYRILGLQPLLAQERIYFYKGIPDLYIKQIQFYGQMADTAAPDSLSGAISLFPKWNIFAGSTWSDEIQPKWKPVYAEQWSNYMDMDEHLENCMRDSNYG